jgi:hypothetical protein
MAEISLKTLSRGNPREFELFNQDTGILQRGLAAMFSQRALTAYIAAAGVVMAAALGIPIRHDTEPLPAR